jgi:hypothetical protein
MYRRLIVLALAGLLVACTTQGNGETDEPPGSGAAESAGASGGASSGASAACEGAFAPLAEMQISSVSELGDLPNEVEPTIESCESVADWIAGAQQVIEEEIRPNTAVFLLRIKCEDPSFNDTPICEELASS